MQPVNNLHNATTAKKGLGRWFDILLPVLSAVTVTAIMMDYYQALDEGYAFLIITLSVGLHISLAIANFVSKTFTQAVTLWLLVVTLWVLLALIFLIVFEKAACTCCH